MLFTDDGGGEGDAAKMSTDITFSCRSTFFRTTVREDWMSGVAFSLG